MKFLDDIIDLIDASIKEDAENLITWGNIIKDGYSTEIDHDRAIVNQAHSWVSEYQAGLIEKTGISTLKIKYTSNSGYFIEVPRSQTEKILPEFIQRQTLTQASRYSTQELSEFEQKLQSANANLFEKEYNEFLDIRNNINEQFINLYKTSRRVAQLDFFVNGAYNSLEKWYISPKIHTGYDIDIRWGKHPVISESMHDFISNDMNITKKDFVHVITGPNMWGKSTFLRQNALLILMSHIGYDIPCESAKIWITDRIFSRVGAGDNIFLWQSTFMVEMQEISYILRNSTKNSFVIIDEIGRGTSTYDGMSLAWAILQHNHDMIGAKTLFATHYHEIIDHAQALKWVKNFSVAVWETDGNIVFLRKIIPGGIKKSYGIEVAKLAGIPEKVLSEAKKMMQELSSEHNFMQLSFDTNNSINRNNDIEENNNIDKYKEFLDKVKNIDINSISPIESFQLFLELQWDIEKLEKNLNNHK